MRHGLQIGKGRSKPRPGEEAACSFVTGIPMALHVDWLFAKELEEFLKFIARKHQKNMLRLSSSAKFIWFTKRAYEFPRSCGSCLLIGGIMTQKRLYQHLPAVSAAPILTPSSFSAALSPQPPR